MKKLLIVITVITSMFLISCDSHNALKFNDKLVNAQSDLLKLIDNSKLNEPAGMATKIDKIKKFIKEKITEIDALKAPDGAEAFKKAMLEYLDGAYKLYDQTLKLADINLSEAEYAKVEAEYTLVEAKAEVLENKVIQEQRNFARAKNFDLKR